MNQKQKLAINAEMKEIIKALESKLESFLEYLKLKSIVDDNEIRRVKMYDYMVSRISEILLVIEKKDSGWDALIEFLDTNGEEILARHLRKKGGASPAATTAVVIPPSVQLKESDSKPPPTGETVKISAKRLRDSQKQEEVIKMYSKELSEAIISELMISHLRKIGLLTREEEQIVERKGSDTKQNLEIFHLMKNKAGWWEALIEYLVIYKAIYLKDQLIETLKSEA